MNSQVVVCNAGPLVALAKLDALDLLFQLYGIVYTPPTVYGETVTEGLALNASDALLLNNYFDRGVLAVKTLETPQSLEESVRIHKGERESIQLAIQLHATEYLVDDSHARRVAEQNFSVAVTSGLAQDSATRSCGWSAPNDPTPQLPNHPTPTPSPRSRPTPSPSCSP